MNISNITHKEHIITTDIFFITQGAGGTRPHVPRPDCYGEQAETGDHASHQKSQVSKY